MVVTNQDTNVATELVTNGAGQFTAPYLPAGTYTVAVTLPGFAPFRRTGVVVGTAETVRVAVEMSVSKVGETVEVSAEAPLLQTDRTSVSGAIGAEMIEALPNITQNPLAYAFLQAGAVPRNATNDTQGANSFGIGVDGRRQWSAVGVNGGRAFTNDIQLDGLPVMGGGYNEASVVPNTEGLQEVRVISNNFSAEYGRGQAVIAMSTKSGTNAFRGQGVYMIRHEGLDANTFSNNAQNIPKREFRVNDAGGSIGGPILRNKLFFFTQLPRPPQQPGLDAAADGADRARAGRQLQPDLHPRRERQRRSRRASSTPRTSSRKGPDLYPPRRDSRTRSFRTRIRPRCACSATTRCRTGRRTTCTTRTTSRRRSLHDGPPSQLEQPRRLPRTGKHSIYGSGGISYAEIVTPRPFGEAPFNDADGVRGDKNPYFQIGDAIVLSTPRSSSISATA